MNTQAFQIEAEYNPFAKILPTDLSNRAVQIALENMGRKWVRELIILKVQLTRVDMDYLLSQIDFDDIFDALEEYGERVGDVNVVGAALEMAGDAAREALVAVGLLEC